MTRNEQRAKNFAIIQLVATLLTFDGRRASYKAIVAFLNEHGQTTTRGNHWTPKRLFRMLQREGISGLHGLVKIEGQELRLKIRVF